MLLIPFNKWMINSCSSQVDAESPLLREWALWGVRNLCEGNEAAQRAIADLQACTAVDSAELQKLGLRVELDKDTGKLKVERREPTDAGAGKKGGPEKGKKDSLDEAGLD